MEGPVVVRRSTPRALGFVVAVALTAGTAGTAAHAAPAPGPEAVETAAPAERRGTGPAALPTSATGVGAAPLGSTSYPVPADAIHVRAGAPDGGNGSAARPFNSIQRAVWNGRSGSTIVVQSGVYHEYVGVFNDVARNSYRNRVTIQAAPGAEVWLDGSQRVTSWARSGSTWVADWEDDKHFNTVAGFGSAAEVGDLSFVGPQNPMAADPSQVFLDGRQLQQVAANPGAGQFAMVHNTTGADRIVLGENPAGREVRVSKLHQAIVSNAEDLTLRGIGVRGYATPLNWMGTVYLEGDRPVVENMVFDSLPTIPLFLSRTDGALVQNVTSVDGGLQGISARAADNSTFRDIFIHGANQQLFNSAPTAGGFKLGQMQNFVIEGLEVVDTRGATGIWVDESGVSFTIVNNTVRGSGSNGIHVEISACAVVSGNTLIDNAGNGIEVLGSPRTWLTNNVISGSGSTGKANISVLQDARRQADGGMGIDPRHPDPDPLNTWITTDVHILNNVLGAPHPGALGQLDVHDRAGQSYGDAMVAQIAGNVVVDRSAQDFARWGTPGHRAVTYADTVRFAAERPVWGPHNRLAPETTGLRRLLDLAAQGSGVALDGTVTSALGLAPGSAVVGIP